MKRRDFLKASVLATAALTSTPLTARAETEKKQKNQRLKDTRK
jgi:hypothetical protein